MFSFFRRRRGRGRRIFRYHDGAAERSIDPVEAWSALGRAAGEHWVEHLKTLTLKTPPAPPGVDVSKVAEDLRVRQEEAALKLADAACGAFGVAAYKDEAGRATGLTRAERVALVADFFGYMARLGEAVRPFGI